MNPEAAEAMKTKVNGFNRSYAAQGFL